MQKVLLIVSLFVAAGCLAQNVEGGEFSIHFFNKTMRIDYIHHGNSVNESFTLVGIKNDGEWGGRVKVMDDPWNLGLYAFDIVDDSTGELLYTQGFCSVFGEWQTTMEAKELQKNFAESIRFPWPKRKFKLIMRKRDSTNLFHEIWEEHINPNHYELAWQKPDAKIRYFLKNGEPKEKVDIVLLADGYAITDTAAFTSDVGRFIDAFFSVEPFKSRKTDFNVAAVYALSPVSGIRLERSNYYPSNILGCTFYTFGIERYVLSEKEWTVRDYAAAVPYDFIGILLNTDKYGGGGIYNLYTTESARTYNAGYVMVHEMGHHIAGLADEYYTSDIPYQVSAPKYEPWEFNITALLNPDSLKWRNLVDPNIPIPTPWQKERYERKNKLILDDETYSNRVGAFEGAGYLSKGMYRPQINCIMFSHTLEFCRVCQQGLNRVLDMYVAR